MISASISASSGLFEREESLGKVRHECCKGLRWRFSRCEVRRVAQRLFKAVQGQYRPLMAGDRIEDQCFQFAHVARKAIRVEELVEGERHRRRLLAQRASRFVDKVLDQEGQVARAGTQRRQVEMVRPQPIIQILAERPGAHLLRDLSIGGAYDPGAALPRPVRTEGIKGAILQEP